MRNDVLKRTIPALALLALCGIPACTSGLVSPKGAGSQPLRPTGNVSQGFAPSSSWTDTVVDRGIIETVVESSHGDEEITLVAFVAQDGSGNRNVWLAAVKNLSSEGLPTAFTQELEAIFHNERCENCHGFPQSISLRPDFHHPSNPTVNELPGINCSQAGCHESSLTGVSEWTAPQKLFFNDPDDPTLGAELDFIGKTPEEIIAALNQWETIKMMRDPTFDIATEHFANDDRINWALVSGVVPQGHPRKTPVGVEPSRFTALLNAWDAAGRVANAAGATLALVEIPNSDPASRVAIGYDPATQQVSVAFTSTSPALGGANGFQQVYLARYDLAVLTPFGIALTPSGSPAVMSGTTVVPGNADSSAPAISQDGSVVAFESLATNLVSGFSDGNGAGAPDVFEQVVGTSSVLLVSGSGTTGGDGGSYAPSLDATGSACAFESDATDLAPGAGNGRRNVLLQDGSGIELASRGGADGQGGSTRASVAVRNGVALVAFESTVPGLPGGASGGTAQIYLFRSDTGTVTLASKTTHGAPGDDDSSMPHISPDGRRMVFQSAASNLDPQSADTNKLADVFVANLDSFIDLGDLSLRRLSKSGSGAEAKGGDSTSPIIASFSRPGITDMFEYVVGFDTAATNLGAEVQTPFVILYDEPNFTPSIVLDVSPVTLDANDESCVVYDVPLIIDASGSSDAAGDALSFQWSVDGVPQPPMDPANPARFEITFGDVAVHTVLLEVTDSRDALARRLLTFDSVLDDTPPVASAGTYADQGNDTTIQLTGSVTAPANSVLSYRWTIDEPGGGQTLVPTSGPGTVIIDAMGNPAVITNTIAAGFSALGTYSIALEVTDTCGGSGQDTTTLGIVADDPPTCSFHAQGATVIFPGDDYTLTADIDDPDGGLVGYQLYQGTSVAGTLIASGTLAVPSSISQVVTPSSAGALPYHLVVTDPLQGTSTCDTTVTVTGPVPYFPDVQDTLTGLGCVGCHNDSLPDGGFSLTTPSTAYTFLTTTASPCGGTCSAIVVANQPGQSCLLLMIQGMCDAMPPTGPWLGTTDSEYITIQQWIASGANYTVP